MCQLTSLRSRFQTLLESGLRHPVPNGPQYVVSSVSSPFSRPGSMGHRYTFESSKTSSRRLGVDGPHISGHNVFVGKVKQYRDGRLDWKPTKYYVSKTDNHMCHLFSDKADRLSGELLYTYHGEKPAGQNIAQLGNFPSLKFVPSNNNGQILMSSRS